MEIRIVSAREGVSKGGDFPVEEVLFMGQVVASVEPPPKQVDEAVESVRGKVLDELKNNF